MRKKKILFLVNSLSFFISHRIEIAYAAKNKGYDIEVGYGELGNTKTSILSKKGIRCFKIPLERQSINPFKEIVSLFFIYKVFIRLKPDIVHLITIKPYLYGGIAGKLARVPCLVSAVAGLGILFDEEKWRSFFYKKLLKPLFYFALSHSNQIIIIQNQQNKKTLINWIGLDKKKFLLLPGSGVNISKFKNLSYSNKEITICFASRLLKNKGVFDFISAAKIIKNSGIKARFLIAGNLDPSNPDSLNKKDLNKIIKDKVVEYLNYQKDIPSLYARSHIICLPSFYGEGLPKALIEGAAAGRAIITTNVPGCRDSLIPNKTGLLVPKKNPQKLAKAIKYLIENPQIRIRMGKEGRKFAKKKFPVEKIISSHIKIYNDLIKNT